MGLSKVTLKSRVVVHEIRKTPCLTPFKPNPSLGSSLCGVFRFFTMSSAGNSVELGKVPYTQQGPSQHLPEATALGTGPRPLAPSAGANIAAGLRSLL